MFDIVVHQSNFGEGLLTVEASAYLLNEFTKVSFHLPISSSLFLRKRFSEISKCIHPDLTYLKEAVFTHLHWHFECYKNEYFSEQTLHRKFSNELSDILPGAEIMEYKSIQGHIPDFMIAYKGYVMPVEIKLGRFTNSAVKQLQRYMEEYKATRGIAVSSEGGVKLPSNIKAVDIKLSEPEFNPYNVPIDILEKIEPAICMVLGLSSQGNL